MSSPFFLGKLFFIRRFFIKVRPRGCKPAMQHLELIAMAVALCHYRSTPVQVGGLHHQSASSASDTSPSVQDSKKNNTRMNWQKSNDSLGCYLLAMVPRMTNKFKTKASFSFHP